MELNRETIKEVLKLLGKIMTDKKDYLIELDSVIGDGDLGLTMSKGFGKVAEDIQSLDETDLGKLFMKTGMILAQTVPSTMGTLMASGFLKAGKALFGSEVLDHNGLAEFFNQFVEGIMQRGKAQPGDKTVVDALYPAAQAIKKAAEEQKNMKEGMNLAYEAAKNGLEKTKEMKSKFGKAACFQEKTIGKQDPGATVGMFFVQGFYEIIAG